LWRERRLFPFLFTERLAGEEEGKKSNRTPAFFSEERKGKDSECRSPRKPAYITIRGKRGDSTLSSGKRNPRLRDQEREGYIPQT